MVQEWLTSLGAELDVCAGFNYDPISGDVQLHMYKRHPDTNRFYVDQETKEPAQYYRVVHPDVIPDCLLERK